MKDNGTYKLLTDKDFEMLNKHLMKQGGRIVKSSGSVRVETDGDKTLTQSAKRTSFKDYMKSK